MPSSTLTAATGKAHLWPLKCAAHDGLVHPHCMFGDVTAAGTGGTCPSDSQQHLLSAWLSQQHLTQSRPVGPVQAGSTQLCSRCPLQALPTAAQHASWCVPTCSPATGFLTVAPRMQAGTSCWCSRACQQHTCAAGAHSASMQAGSTTQWAPGGTTSYCRLPQTWRLHVRSWRLSRLAPAGLTCLCRCSQASTTCCGVTGLPAPA